MIRPLLDRLRFVRDHRWTRVHLSAYLDGELGPSERARVEEHTHWCPDCRRLLESLRRTLQGLMDLRAAAGESVAPRVIDRLRRET